MGQLRTCFARPRTRVIALVHAAPIKDIVVVVTAFIRAGLVDTSGLAGLEGRQTYLFAAAVH